MIHTINTLVTEHYKQVLGQLPEATTEQRRIRNHQYAVGFIAHMFDKSLDGGLNLRGDSLAERLQHIEEIVG